MKNNKIVIETEKEQLIESMKSAIENLEENESVVLITVKKEGERVTTNAPSSISPKHIPMIIEAFKQVMLENMKLLAQEDPMMATLLKFMLRGEGID